MTTEILLAGFGGQGVLFAGKILANCGLMDSKELSWLPSYGPEMRGGTAIAMNQPSYDKFINAVKPGGKAFIDSTLIESKCERTDIECFYIPSSQLADENELQGGSNIILLGKLIKETGIFSLDTMKKAIEKVVPPSKAKLIANNFRAIEMGMNN